MSILEMLDGVIRKPATTLNYIACNKPIGWALAIFAISSLLGLVSTDTSAVEEYLTLPAPGWVLQIAFAFAGLFLFAGFLHLLSRIFKSTGDFWGLFSALGFAQFPGFLAPVATLVKGGGGIVGSILGGIISLGSGIWVLVLYVIALRESHGITTGASIATYLIALFIIVALIIIGTIIIAAALAPLLL